MIAKSKSVSVLLIVLFLSILARLFAGNLAFLDVIKKVSSVTWNC